MSEIRYKKVLPFKEKMKVMFRTVTHPHLKNSVPPYMLFCNPTHKRHNTSPHPYGTHQYLATHFRCL